MKKIVFTGDLMALIPENKAAKKGNSYDYSPVFNEISKTLQGDDYVIGNLETPIGDKELGWTDHPTIFNTPKEFAEAAVNAGFSCFSLSNNHCLDRGIPGLNQTLQNLRKLNVDTVGVYDEVNASKQPLIKTFGDKKYAFLSFTYGTNSAWRNNKLSDEDRYHVDLIREQEDFNGIKENKRLQKIKNFIKEFLPQKIREKISPLVIPECVRNEEGLIKDSYYYNHLKEKINNAKRESDFVVMLLHAGGQYNDQVGQYTRNVCESLIELGSDMIVVNHPHCILPYEYINGKLVLYALGNFCFTPNFGFYNKNVYADYSLIFNLYLSSEGTIEKKSIEICKVVKEKSGHSVVYPLFDLIENSKGIKKEKLIQDNFAVLRRFFQDKASEINVISREYYF